MSVEDADGEVGLDVLEHARLILDTANDAFVSMGRDGRIIDWNRAAERTFGWARADALGQPLVELIIPPRYREAHMAGVERFLTTGEGPLLFQTLELPALRSDGGEFRAEVTIWPSHSGERVRFNAFVRDVTERVQIHARLALLQRVTAAANEADSIEGAVCAALEEIAGLTAWPVGHAYLRGWEEDELAPSGWWTAAAEDHQAFREATAQRRFRVGEGLPGRVAQTGRPSWIHPLTADPNYPRKQAAVASGLISAFAFPVLSGDRVVAVLEFYATRPERPDDQTLELMANIGVQLGRVFERFRWEAELREAMQTKSRLASMLAHEIRTPLAAIEGFAAILLADCEEEGDQEKVEQLEIIHRSAERLQRLVSQALTAARLDAGAQPVAPAAVSVRGVVDAVVQELQLSDVVEVVGEDGQATADPDHVTQILTNFLANAATYGRPPITVEIDGDARPGHVGAGSVVVRICDQGDGIPPEFVGRLFRRFSRGASGGSGAGLGLSIVRELAELNHGAVWYEPIHPTGACFAVRLPAR